MIFLYIIFFAAAALYVIVLIIIIYTAYQETTGNDMESQSQKIVNHLLAWSGRTISTWEAYEKYNITTLAQRIFDLRNGPPIVDKAGVRYEIRDRTVTRDGKTFSEYWLERYQEQTELF